MNERIRKVRKALDLTQRDFGTRIGTTQNAIANYETGHRNPSSAVIDNICKTFNVDETWLRTGEGEMFVELPRNEALAAQIQSFLKGGTDSFRERLVSLLLRLTPEQWDVLERYLLELTATPTAEAPAKPPRKMSDAEYHAELDRQLSKEKKQAESLSASGRGNSETASG